MGPDIMWGPDGPLQDPMKEESDIRGQDAYKKFAAACASNGVDLNQPDITVFVPTDLVVDDFEAAGGVLTAACSARTSSTTPPPASPRRARPSPPPTRRTSRATTASCTRATSCSSPAGPRSTRAAPARSSSPDTA